MAGLGGTVSGRRERNAEASAASATSRVLAPRPAAGGGPAACAGGGLRAGAAGARAGEHHHHADILLKAGRIGREHEDGTRGAIADDAHPRPDIDGARQPVAAGRDKDDALAGVVFRLVDGGLEGGAVVGWFRRRERRIRRVQVNRFGVVGAGGDSGGRERGGREALHQDREQQIPLEAHLYFPLP